MDTNEVFSLLEGKSEYSRALFEHFISEFKRIGEIKVEVTKSMIAVSNAHRRIAWVTQIGKNFIHVVFPFDKAHSNNLCFQKIAQVPGDLKQFNHHFRMLLKEDVNAEVLKFMSLSYRQ
ncbi:MAG: hypothetical protein ACJ76F_05230 [Bacteroidia bacterium]